MPPRLWYTLFGDGKVDASPVPGALEVQPPGLSYVSSPMQWAASGEVDLSLRCLLWYIFLFLLRTIPATFVSIQSGFQQLITARAENPTARHAGGDQ